MTMWKRWIQGGVLCGLLLGGVVGCSMVAHPPVSQVAPTDHAALADWYDKEAAQLRQKAKNMEEMKVLYRNNPAYDHTALGGPHKAGMERHCDALAGLYTKGAEEADELSRAHRSMLK